METIETKQRIRSVQGLKFQVRTSVNSASPYEVVLVHGIGISSRAFAPLHEVLAPHATVHSIDLPGFGGMPKPRTSPDIPEMAALLGTVVQATALVPIIAVGNSMGTQWVVELARQRPELVSHNVLIGPVADEARRTALSQGLALLVDSTRETAPANRMVFREYLRCGPRWYFRQLPHMLRYPIEDRISEHAQPLLIVRGERDPIASVGWCTRLRDSAPNGRLVQIPGEPHLAQYTQPGAVAREIGRLVESDDEWG